MNITRRHFIRNSAGASAALTFCMASDVSHAAKAARPNILWIVAEDISPLFGCYGDPDAETPNIDRYAEKSHLFKRAYATAPICAPSRSCLATGMYATSLGTQNLRSEVKIPDPIKPLAKIFREHGYWTALRGKTDYNFSPDGLFDYWKQDTAPWQSCPKDKPFFSFMNLGSTHEGSGNTASKADVALKRLDPDLKHDPQKITLPPYFPDTKEMRRLWARYLDLLTVYDHDVNEVLKQLNADGRAEDTIVFLMADHGMGLPRYKRWLYLTGLHVPLIIHIPDKFRHLTYKEKRSSVRNDLVSYVDLPPTVLKMAGIPIPGNFQGKDIFDGRKRNYIFGARDRADDMYDLSRAIFDGRYLYIRHYLPHNIPMQEGIIMSPYRKEFHKELYRVHEAGNDTSQSIKLWQPKPYEELYDIKNDPQELRNIADNDSLDKVKNKLHTRLKKWIIVTRDSAFMTEPEMHRVANKYNSTPYEILQNPELYPIDKILEAAENASLPGAPLIQPGKNPVIAYWAVQQRIIRKDKSNQAVSFFKEQVKSTNPMVRTTAAGALASIGHTDPAVIEFKKLLKEEEPNLLLYIARTLAVSFDDVRPLEAQVRAARQRMLAPHGSKRPWKDFNYSAFTTWALEWSLIKSGLNKPGDFRLL